MPIIGDPPILPFLPLKPAIVRASSLDLPPWRDVLRREKDVHQATFPMPFFAGSGTPATVSLTANTFQDTGLTTYTFSSQSIGTAATGRRILVAAGSPANAASRTISSVTIGGNTATAVGSFTTGSGGGAFSQGQLFILQVDTGTTASIVVNWSAAANRCGIGVWAIYNLLSSTPTATLNSTANPQTGSLSISAGGVGIAAAFDYAAATGLSFTWSGLTEQYDQTFSTTDVGHSGAHLASAGAVNPTVTATPAVFTSGAMVAAAFR